MRKIQYGARCLYNRSEIQQLASTIFVIIPFVNICFPINSSERTLLCTQILLCISFIMHECATKNMNNAGKMRNYFDLYVFGHKTNRRTEAEVKELADKEFKRNEPKANKIIQNTGSDKPRGVYNWYESLDITKSNKALEIQFECQKENTWWNKKVVNLSIFLYLAIFSIVFVIMIYLSSIVSPVLIFVCLITWGLSSYNNIRNLSIWVKKRIEINILENNAESDTSEENVFKLQEAIEEFRTIPVAEFNIIHALCAKTLSQQYKSRIS